MPQLNALRILVTRPDPAGSELCALLKKAGYWPIHFPTIQFAPPPNASLFEAQRRAMDQFDWLIFISPQAVATTFSKTCQISAHIQIAAVGEGTAVALSKQGYCVLHPKQAWNSEALCELPQLQNIAGKKIAIIKGVGGRDVLQTQFLARGAKVTEIIAYQRVLPEIDITPYLKCVQNKEIDIMICASLQGIQNLKLLLGERGWPFIKNIPLIVPSHRLQVLAQELGFATIQLTQNPNHVAILEFLGAHYGR